jgi:pre-mRNA-splicing factor ATP-dependent RNA helicase DHX15/PRP43
MNDINIVNKKIGILDPLGLELNPLTGKEYSDTYKELGKIWSKFPAYEKSEDIIKGIIDNNVILITSGTGSGKTVLVPKYCLHAFNYKGKIAVTLPKQVITESAAEFAAKTLDIKLGEQVGYKFRGSNKKAYSPNNNLLYATDGTIVAKILKDPTLKEFDAVIIDEAHERKVQIDFLLYLLKEVIKNRPEFKLIIMSATIDVTIFKKYYDDFKFLHLDIGGKTNYKITSKFLDKNLKGNEYIDEGINIIKKLLNEKEDGDILFFVSSISETKSICEKLDSENNNHFCVEVYSGMDKNRQILAQEKDLYKEQYNKTRKVAISTNVAESSLTIDGIKFVIDSGLELYNYYDPEKRSNVLEKQFITHAQAKQRMGRAGRTSPGICYHLYTENTFNKEMRKFPEPEIKKSNLDYEFLKLLQIPSIQSVDNLRKILKEFIEPPSQLYIDSGLNTLQTLNLIDLNGVTTLGKIVTDLQMDPMEAMAFFASHHLNCSKEVAVILSMIGASRASISQFFNKPNEILLNKKDNRMIILNRKFNESMISLTSKYGDHITLLLLFNKYLENKDDKKKLEEFTYKYFLRNDTLNKSKQTFNRVYGIYKRGLLNKKMKIDKLMDFDIRHRVLTALYFGFKINSSLISDIKADISKSSFINYSFDPKSSSGRKKKVLYHELFTTSGKTNMNIISVITPHTLELYEIFVKVLNNTDIESMTYNKNDIVNDSNSDDSDSDSSNKFDYKY